MESPPAFLNAEEELRHLKQQLQAEAAARRQASDTIEQLQSQCFMQALELSARENSVKRLNDDAARLQRELEQAHKTAAFLSQRLPLPDSSRSVSPVKHEGRLAPPAAGARTLRRFSVDTSLVAGSASMTISRVSARPASPSGDFLRPPSPRGPSPPQEALLRTGNGALLDPAQHNGALAAPVGSQLSYKNAGVRGSARRSSTSGLHDLNAGSPPPPERQGADVLVIGQHADIAAVLSRGKHHVVEVDVSEVLATISRATFDAVLCNAEVFMGLTSDNSPVMETLKSKQADAVILTFRLDRDFKDCLRTMDLTGRPLQPTQIQELVKAQITVLLQTMWIATSLQRSPSETQQMLKDREAEMALSLVTLENTVKELREEKRRADSEHDETRRRLADATAANVAYEEELGGLRQKLEHLKSKLSTAELQQIVNTPRERPAMDLRRELTESFGKGFVLSQYKQENNIVAASVSRAETPQQTAAKVFVLMLRDDCHVDLRPYVESSLQSLSGPRIQAADLEEHFHKSGVDTVVQDWMLYEFSRGQLRTSSRNASLTALPPPNEDPLELVDVPDLSVVLDWGFRPFELSVDQMVTLYVHMIETLGLVSAFSVPRNNLVRFARGAAAMYRRNSYHSFIHAFDVSQMAFRLVHQSNVRDFVTDLDVFCLMVCALCHDLDHPGLNNTFQVNDGSPLAMIYNDQSPLENHHASRTFALLNTPGHNVFAGLGEAAYVAARRIIIQGILNTDMSFHFDLVSKFTTQLSLHAFSGKTQDSRQLLFNLLLHVADISNVTRPWPVSKAWSDRMLDEFFAQGDVEKQKGLTVSPLMDRETTNQNKMSLSFIDFIVSPALSTLGRLLPCISVLSDSLATNRQLWEQRQIDEAADIRAGIVSSQMPASGYSDPANRSDLPASPGLLDAGYDGRRRLSYGGEVKRLHSPQAHQQRRGSADSQPYVNYGGYTAKPSVESDKSPKVAGVFKAAMRMKGLLRRGSAAHETAAAAAAALSSPAEPRDAISSAATAVSAAAPSVLPTTPVVVSRSLSPPTTPRAASPAGSPAASFPTHPPSSPIDRSIDRQIDRPSGMAISASTPPLSSHASASGVDPRPGSPLPPAKQSFFHPIGSVPKAKDAGLTSKEASLGTSMFPAPSPRMPREVTTPEFSEHLVPKRKGSISPLAGAPVPLSAALDSTPHGVGYKLQQFGTTLPSIKN